MSFVKHWTLRSKVSPVCYGKGIKFQSILGGIVLDSKYCQLFSLGSNNIKNLVAFNNGAIYINKMINSWSLIGIVDSHLVDSIIHTTPISFLPDAVFLCISKNNTNVIQYWVHIGYNGCTVMKDRYSLNNINVCCCRSAICGKAIFYTFNANMKNMLTVYNLENNQLISFELDIKKITLEGHGFININKNKFVLFKNNVIYFLKYNSSNNRINLKINISNNFVPVRYFWYAKIGSLIFIFGGINSSDGNESNLIQYFDLKSKKGSVSRVILPEAKYSYSGGACVDWKEYIHLAGNLRQNYIINSKFVTEVYIKYYLKSLPNDLFLLILKYVACEKCVQILC